MERPFGDDIERHVLGQRALRLAVDVDHDDRVHEEAGHQELGQRLFLDMDRGGILIVAIDHGGHAAITTKRTGGSLANPITRSEEHTSELQSLMRSSYAVFCLKKTTKKQQLTTARPNATQQT